MQGRRELAVGDPNYQEAAQAESRKYFKIYRTILEIMEARGYVRDD